MRTELVESQHTCMYMCVRIAMLLVLLLFLTSTASASGVIIRLSYWIYCIMFSNNLSVFLYPSTSSSVVTVCDGANVTLTCVTDTGTLVWATATGRKTFKSGFMENSSTDALGDYFIVRLTNMQNMTLTSELTIVAPPPSLRETMILCRDDGYPVSSFIEKTLLISCIWNVVLQNISLFFSYRYSFYSCQVEIYINGLHLSCAGLDNSSW